MAIDNREGENDTKHVEPRPYAVVFIHYFSDRSHQILPMAASPYKLYDRESTRYCPGMKLSGRAGRSGCLMAFLISLSGCSQAGDAIYPTDPARKSGTVSEQPDDRAGAWQSNRISGEARLLRGEEPARLYWQPERIEGVYSYGPDGEIISYAEGADWKAVEGGIVRTAGSRIPDFAEYHYFYVPSGQSFRQRLVRFAKGVLGQGSSAGERGKESFEFSSEPRNPPLTLNHVVYIDYHAKAPDEPIVPKPLSKPASRIFCMGDSITEGAHTIASFYRREDADSWCGLLRKNFGDGREFINFSKGGSTVSSAVERYDTASAEAPPDLLILAFGMNDHVAGPDGLDAFRKGLVTMIKRAQGDGAEIILVGFFQQNPNWMLESPSDSVAYNKVIAETADRYGLEFIDMYDIFERADPQFESYHNLTGDYMHHPNNYGQRIYYSSLVPFFIEEPLRPSQIADYVRIRD